MPTQSSRKTIALFLALALLLISFGLGERAYATANLSKPSLVAVTSLGGIPNDFESSQLQETGVLTATDMVTGTTGITDTTIATETTAATETSGITETPGITEATDITSTTGITGVTGITGTETATGAGALAESETLSSKTAANLITSQRLATPRAMRNLIPLNPQFEVNSRQAMLRDHHLVSAPIPTVPMEETLEAQAFDKGPATSVLPIQIGEVGADSPVVIVRNRGLNDTESGDITSTVSEPSVAASRDGVVLITANWFAAISKDDGQSFTFMNPAETFPETDGHDFCCDQLALYDPSTDIMFWFLQYIQNGSSNKIRLAYAQGADIANENWSYYDFTPQTVGGWNNEWFDYPDLALSRDHLYISTNSFSTNGTPSTSDDGFARAVVMRLPLAQIAADEPVSVEYFDSEESFSFRLSQGAQEVMYFGSHDFARFGAGIEVYAWPEGSSQISLRRIQVDPWSNDPRNSLGPDGSAWLRRTDFRMSGAWVQGGEVGFAWTAAQDANFSQPQVRVAIVDINAAGNTPVAQPHIWNDSYAFAYPSAVVNSAGTLGIGVAYGGGGINGVNPSHAVGVLNETEAGYVWRLIATDTGDNGPADGRWGDYLSLSLHGQNPQVWVASGYTLHGGPLPRDIVPRVVYFQEVAEITEPSEPQQSLAELRAEAEKLREQVELLLQKISELETLLGGIE